MAIYYFVSYGAGSSVDIDELDSNGSHLAYRPHDRILIFLSSPSGIVSRLSADALFGVLQAPLSTGCLLKRSFTGADLSLP